MTINDNRYRAAFDVLMHRYPRDAADTMARAVVAAMDVAGGVHQMESFITNEHREKVNGGDPEWAQSKPGDVTVKSGSGHYTPISKPTPEDVMIYRLDRLGRVAGCVEALIKQIEIGDFVDGAGHPLESMGAYIETKRAHDALRGETNDDRE